MQLKQLKVGSKAIITSLAKGCSCYRKRLIAMGLIPGTEITLTRIAPLGDPIEVKVRGFMLTLRKDEAGIVNIEAL
ncbi:MAG: ferrous iron transport protein A [Gammaproteobacteria bacterium]|nr:ferrous iron transport protein A [Gammaproteobacteria bacterium]